MISSSQSSHLGEEIRRTAGECEERDPGNVRRQFQPCRQELHIGN